VSVDRRWLVPIAIPATVAIWSGWVGLGGMTGFGVVKPLPGIWDGLTVNTAITLPIGVEAYAAYALSVATSGREMPAAARRFAAWSAGAALVLGAVGQVAYHLLAAHGATRAPWVVTVIVSCLPVAVLGAASYLYHLTARSSRAAGRAAAAPARSKAEPPALERASDAASVVGAPSGLALVRPAVEQPLGPKVALAVADALAWRAEHGVLPGLSQLEQLGEKHARKTAQRALKAIEAQEAAA